MHSYITPADSLAPGMWRVDTMRVAEAAYVAFLLLVFVGLSPFAMPNSGADTIAGAGDSLRQVFYMAVFGIIIATAFLRQGWRFAGALPAGLALLLGWCLLSAAWSVEPSVTFRRAILVGVVAASAMMSVNLVGTRKALLLFAYVMAGITIVNWLSIFILPQAKHLTNDYEPALAGDWRGLYAHKNISGAVCANAIITFLYFAAKMRRLAGLVLALVCFGFLIGTDSKSSLGLLPLAMIAGATYYCAARNRIDRQIILTVCALFAFILFAGIVLYWNRIAVTLADPQAFTGRGAIWQAEFAFIFDHPLLGSGFGTFSDTGQSSPIYTYISSTWVGEVFNGHQGYLELLVTLGIPGFALAMTSLLVQPAWWFGSRSALDLDCRALLFTLFAFFLMHNFMETDFLRPDGVEWVTFLLALAMLRSSRIGPTVALR